jgi:hypothetical protein
MSNRSQPKPRSDGVFSDAMNWNLLTAGTLIGAAAALIAIIRGVTPVRNLEILSPALLCAGFVSLCHVIWARRRYPGMDIQDRPYLYALELPVYLSLSVATSFTALVVVLSHWR